MKISLNGCDDFKIFAFLANDSTLPKVWKGLRAEASRGQILFGLVPGGAAPAHQAGGGVAESSQWGRAVFGG
jgi:hypothetical protein